MMSVPGFNVTELLRIPELTSTLPSTLSSKAASFVSSTATSHSLSTTTPSSTTSFVPDLSSNFTSDDTNDFNATSYDISDITGTPELTSNALDPELVERILKAVEEIPMPQGLISEDDDSSDVTSDDIKVAVGPDGLPLMPGESE